MDVDQRQGMGKKGFLDLLVLSHYDKDHMNGAELLTDRFRVNRIVVPFISPEELMLVLASQAADITAAMVTELHQLANGRQTLFGVPVTMVQSGDRDVRNADAPGGGEPAEPPGDEAADGEWPPRSMIVSEGPNQQPLAAILMDSQDVQLAFNADRPGMFWKLRFWNRGVDNDLLAYLFDELVACDFPLHALDDHTACAELAQWLDDKDNRDDTVAAYGKAIARYAPTWASDAAGKKLANFLSLGLYSGPDAVAQSKEMVMNTAAYLPTANGNGYPETQRLRYTHPRWRPDTHELVGWLGTGDAPLGEPSVWADFGKHYRTELLQTRTVLTPHHGAAPLGGPRFYNPKLNPTSGMLAVISFGKTNTFGHPRAAVLKQAMAARASIQLVTEDDAIGLHEVFVLSA